MLVVSNCRYTQLGSAKVSNSFVDNQIMFASTIYDVPLPLIATNMGLPFIPRLLHRSRDMNAYIA